MLIESLYNGIASLISMLDEFIVFTFCAVLAVVGLIALYKILPDSKIGT